LVVYLLAGVESLLADEHVEVFTAVQLEEAARLRAVGHARPRRPQPARRARRDYPANTDIMSTSGI
jgi:hypothetical protein